MVTQAQAEQFNREAQETIRASAERLWGYEPIGRDGVLFIGDELSPEQRTSLIQHCSSFTKVFFLAGFSREIHNKDMRLAQRVLMYGGTLPNWKWALADGEWKQFFNDC